MTLTDRTCAFPPHPESAEPQPPAVVTDSALSRFRGWLRHAPAERVPLPAVPVVWTATEIMHAAGVHGLYTGTAATVAAAVAYGTAARRTTKPDRSPHPKLGPGEIAAAIGAVGAWVTAGTIWGPLAGPDHALSLAYAAGSIGGYWWLRRHEAVRAARARRDAAAGWEAKKTAWHRLAPLLGLRGSHLLAYDDTLLGDTMLIDTRGTGKRASQVSAREVAERLGEIEMIPAGRIDVTTDRIPGRLRITVRRKDPWAHPLMHPVTHPDSPYARFVEEPATCRKPLVIGGDPETGDPLRLTLWDEDEGGKVIMIVAKKGSGKTVLLSCLSERITACPDAQLIQVNLGKHREDSRWAPLAACNALGREDIGRARRILQWVVNAIEERSNTGSASKMQPTPETPLLVVKVDEVDLVARDPVCKQLLSDIASKCRSECVALVFAGQRATAQWMGGADLRANVDIAVLGRVARAAEARKATGEEIELPDMGAYGEGNPGVWLITELGGGGGYDRGRVFKLEAPAEIEAIVTRRAASRRPYVPEPALGRLAAAWAKITGAAPLDDADESADALAAIAPAGGQVVPGTEGIAAKIGAARAAASAPVDVADVDPEVWQQVRAERQRQFLAEYAGIDIPEAELNAVLSMIAAPGGTSTGKLAEALGIGRTTAHRYLTRLSLAGHAEVRGKGRGAGFHATRAAAGAGGTHLHLVPPDDGTASGDST
jgi:hypothetical protein